MGAAKHKRRIGAVLEFLDPTDDNGLHIRLARWCRGGALGWLFDKSQELASKVPGLATLFARRA